MAFRSSADIVESRPGTLTMPGSGRGCEGWPSDPDAGDAPTRRPVIRPGGSSTPGAGAPGWRSQSTCWRPARRRATSRPGRGRQRERQRDRRRRSRRARSGAFPAMWRGHPLEREC